MLECFECDADAHRKGIRNCWFVAAVGSIHIWIRCLSLILIFFSRASVAFENNLSKMLGSVIRSFEGDDEKMLNKVERNWCDRMRRISRVLVLFFLIHRDRPFRQVFMSDGTAQTTVWPAWVAFHFEPRKPNTVYLRLHRRRCLVFVCVRVMVVWSNQSGHFRNHRINEFPFGIGPLEHTSRDKQCNASLVVPARRVCLHLGWLLNANVNPSYWLFFFSLPVD